MAIRTVSASSLKKIKNSVIGNPLAKVKFVRDELFVRSLIDCLNPPHPSTTSPFQDPQASCSQVELRIEAAHIIASLSYGSEEALGALLRADAPRAFLYAISNFTQDDSLALRTAFARALKSLTACIADIVGPSQWSLGPEKFFILTETKDALNHIFSIESLDVYLPLLTDPSAQISASIAQLLGTSVRTAEHRKAIVEWLPHNERQKEVKTRRGWEKTSVISANSASRQGGWTSRNLTCLLLTKDYKLQEAALNALAALSMKNPTLALALTKAPHQDGVSPLSLVLSLTKSRQIDVQLAGCLCATHILRANTSSSNYTQPLEEACVRAVFSAVNRSLNPSAFSSPQIQTKVCFILYHLINDEPNLCLLAFTHGCLTRLSHIVHLTTPPNPLPNWDETESELTSRLREAALTAIAALSLFSNDIRRSVTDDQKLLPGIALSLTHKHYAVRYAACQCVRVLSRAVAVLRTNIVDSGLGMVVFGIVKKEEEDRRVLGAALAAVCNIVNEFSPLRPIYLEQGLMPRLVQILVHSEDPSLRLSALWAVKNLLWKTSSETKRDVMNQLGWKQLFDLLRDVDPDLQEQAYNIVRNLAETEEGIDMVFREMGEDILDQITQSLGSSNEDVVLQAASALANLANGTHEQSSLILSRPHLLTALRTCLAESKSEIRRPAVSCILQLAQEHPKKRKALVDAGIVSTLRRLCDWTGVSHGAHAHVSPHPHPLHHPHGLPSPGGGMGVGPGMGMGMSGSPTAGGRSPVQRSPAGVGSGPAPGVYGSWSGSASAMMGYGNSQHQAHHQHQTPYGYMHPVSHYHHHPSVHHPHPALDADKDVFDRARRALDWLEHGDGYGV